MSTRLLPSDIISIILGKLDTIEDTAKIARVSKSCLNQVLLRKNERLYLYQCFKRLSSADVTHISMLFNLAFEINLIYVRRNIQWFKEHLASLNRVKRYVVGLMMEDVSAILVRRGFPELSIVLRIYAGTQNTFTQKLEAFVFWIFSTVIGPHTANMFIRSVPKYLHSDVVNIILYKALKLDDGKNIAKLAKISDICMRYVLGNKDHKIILREFFKRHLQSHFHYYFRKAFNLFIRTVHKLKHKTPHTFNKLQLSKNSVDQLLNLTGHLDEVLKLYNFDSLKVILGKQTGLDTHTNKAMHVALTAWYIYVNLGYMNAQQYVS